MEFTLYATLKFPYVYVVVGLLIKFVSQRIEALEVSLMITFFALAFHNYYPPFFFFSLYTFTSIWNLWSLLGGKYAEFILIFGLLNIVTTFYNERE